MDTLDALRELDADVARKVMGMHVTFDQGDYWPPPLPGKNFSSQPIPHYSVSIKDAWEVFEMPHCDGWSLGRNSDGRYEVINTWCENHVVAVADTAPMAICLAALKVTEAR